MISEEEFYSNKPFELCEKGVFIAGPRKLNPIWKKLVPRLRKAIQTEFDDGCRYFKFTPYSLFSFFADNYLYELRLKFPNETIETATVLSYDIESAFDDCDTLLCYVNPTASDTNLIKLLKFAERINIKTINFYKLKDEDNCIS